MEDAYIIQGGKKLSGEISLSGAKNVALKVIIAGLMFEGPVILENIPRIKDVVELINLLHDLGGKAEFIAKNKLVVDGSGIKKNRVDLFHASKIRVSFMLFAPLLAKFGKCYIPNPGGCRIGARPIDRIVEGMKSLGVAVDYNPQTGYYQAVLKDKLRGSYRFFKTTHTGTELLILLSVIGAHQIVLENTALEPEIDNLISFLNEGGGRIRRAGTKIFIDGQKKLVQKKSFKIISDRNELVTYVCLVLATKGEIKIGPIPFHLIKTFYDQVKAAGGDCKKLADDRYYFSYAGPLKSSKIETAPHPGFMTDWQPNWAVLMTQAKGESLIVERVFENRFSYVSELRKLGAVIDFVPLPLKNLSDYFFFNFDPAKKYYQAIKIKGPQKLHGGVLSIADLRAGATLAIGALLAEGESVVEGAGILERGYEDFIDKIKSLGGKIKKI
jgi:UDP-N-acetylglucosamine 1-carboxyvinyltransferase